MHADVNLQTNVKMNVLVQLVGETGFRVLFAHNSKAMPEFARPA